VTTVVGAARANIPALLVRAVSTTVLAVPSACQARPRSYRVPRARRPEAIEQT